MRNKRNEEEEKKNIEREAEYILEGTLGAR